MHESFEHWFAESGRYSFLRWLDGSPPAWGEVLDRQVDLLRGAWVCRASGNPDEISRRARALSRCSHPHLLSVYDHHRVSGGCVAITERVRGGWMSTSTHTVPELGRLGALTIDALQHFEAHAGDVRLADVDVVRHLDRRFLLLPRLAGSSAPVISRGAAVCRVLARFAEPGLPAMAVIEDSLAALTSVEHIREQLDALTG